MTRQSGTTRGTGGQEDCREPLPGIVITRGRRPFETSRPRILAFIWGGKVRPTPTLPYGRWRGAA